jgi:hypothetical protein
MLHVCTMSISPACPKTDRNRPALFQGRIFYLYFNCLAVIKYCNQVIRLVFW